MTAQTRAGAPATSHGSFEIYLAWSEKTLIVDAGQNALDVLSKAGVPIEPGCQMCQSYFLHSRGLNPDGSGPRSGVTGASSCWQAGLTRPCTLRL